MGRSGATALLLLLGYFLCLTEVAGFLSPPLSACPGRHGLIREASPQDSRRPDGGDSGGQPEPHQHRRRNGASGNSQPPPRDKRRAPSIPVPGGARASSSSPGGGESGGKRRAGDDSGGKAPLGGYRIQGLLHKSEGSTQQLLEVVARHGANFERNNCAMALNRLSKAAVKEGRRREVVADPRMRLLVDRTATLVHTFNCIELANVINGLSKLAYPVDAAFLQSYTEAAAAYMDEFCSQELSNIINGFANLGHDPGTAFMAHLIRASDLRLEEFNVQELAILINGLTRLGYEPPTPFLEHFTAVFRSKMGIAACQNLANVANSFGKLDYSPPEEFWTEFKAAIHPLLMDFKPQELSNTIHAFGRLNVTVEPELYADLHATAYHRLDSFNLQELCIAFMGLIRLGMEMDEPFLERLVEASRRFLPRANGQDICLLVSGLGRFKYSPNEAWVSALMTRVTVAMPTLNAITLGHLLRFLANLAQPLPPAFLDAVRDRVESVYRCPDEEDDSGQALTCGTVVRLAGSFASLEYIPGPSFSSAVRSLNLTEVAELRPNELSALLHYICRSSAAESMPPAMRVEDIRLARHIVVNNTWSRLSEFSPPHLSSVLTSISRLPWNVPVPFLDASRDVALANFTEVETQEMINLLTAYTRINYHPGKALLDKAVHMLGASLGRLTLQGLTNVINAFAKLGEDPADFLPSFWARTELLLTRFGPRLGLGLLEAAMMLWSLAVLDSPHTESVARLLVNVALDGVRGGEHSAIERIADCYSQLKQALLYAELLRPGLLPPPLLSDFRSAVLEVQRDGRLVYRGDTTVSALQRDVAQAMASVGMEFEEEVDDGVFFYDMVVQPQRDPHGLPLVVEVDGSPHFFCNIMGTALKDTEFKRRLVRAQSNKFAGLVSVPYFRWRRSLAKPYLLRVCFEDAGFDLRDYLPASFDDAMLAAPPGHGGGKKRRRALEEVVEEEDGMLVMMGDDEEEVEEMERRVLRQARLEQQQRLKQSLPSTTGGRMVEMEGGGVVSDVRPFEMVRPAALQPPPAAATPTKPPQAPAKGRSSSSADGQEEEEATTAAAAGEKKPRGRPRKTAATAAATAAAVEGGSGGDGAGAQAEKRRRGRPRKKAAE